jgi:hypothetical protein
MATMIETPTQVRPPWPPPEGCPSWCRDPKEHEPRNHPDDRSHLDLSRYIPISLEAPSEHEKDEWYSDVLDVYLKKHDTQAEPQVNLSRGDAVGVMLTVNEARDLAAALQAVVAEAEAADTETVPSARAILSS